MNDEIMVPLSEVIQALEDVEGIMSWRAAILSGQQGVDLPILAYAGWFMVAAAYLEQTFNYPGLPGELVALDSGQVLRIHSKDECAGTPCPFHAPSNHHMVTWAKNWRGDWALVERLCEHGIGHPDPDSVAYLERRHDFSMLTDHRCDGCCASGTALTTVGERA